MGNYSRYARSQPEREAGVGIPDPPRRCDSCGEECAHQVGSQVLFVVVRRGDREFVASFAEVCNETWSPNGKCHREPKPGVEFLNWLSRCARCYERDLERTRRGKWNYAPAGTETPTEFLSGVRP